MTDLELLKSLYDTCREMEHGSDEINHIFHEALGYCAHRETKRYFIEDGNDYDSGFTCKSCGEDMCGKKIPNYSNDVNILLQTLNNMSITRYNIEYVPYKQKYPFSGNVGFKVYYSHTIHAKSLCGLLMCAVLIVKSEKLGQLPV